MKIIYKSIIIISFIFAIFIYVSTNSSAATQYTIKYCINDGTGQSAEVKKKAGAAYKLRGAGAFSRTGYTMKSWNTKKDGTGTKYALEKEITVKKNLTLYAQWSANKYTVTYNANGGNTATSSKSITYNSTYGTLPTTSRTGYTFQGWFTAQNGGTKIYETTKMTTAKNHTLYAQWKANNYTVTLSLEGGKLTSSATKTVTYGDKYGTLATPVKDGYTFMGWVMNNGTTTINITSNSIVTTAGNHVLTAVWSVNVYWVSFIDEEFQVDQRCCTFGETYELCYSGNQKEIEMFPNVSKVGYDFKGWFTEKNGMGEQITEKSKLLIAQNHKLYSYYTPKTYTIKYDANGGTGETMSSTSVRYDMSFNVEYSRYSRQGYSFVGWTTKQDDVTKVIYDGHYQLMEEDVENVLDGNILTLYAIWQPEEVIIEFSSEYDTDTKLDSIKVKYSERIGELPIPTYENRDFLGWRTEDGQYITSETINSFYSDIVVLYAVTKIKQVNIEFLHFKEGKILKSQQYNIGTMLINTYGGKNPQRKKYLFKGWYIVENGKEIKINYMYQFKKDAKVYAKWEKVSTKKVRNIKAKYISKRKQLNISFSNIDVQGFQVKIIYKGNHYSKNLKRINLNEGKKGKNLFVKLKKYPGSKKDIDATKKIRIIVTPYNLDSTNTKVYGKGKSITLKKVVN